jgi:hypothetical protein
LSDAALTSLDVLQGVVVCGGSLHILVFIAAAVFRLSFAYPLEVTEGASLEGVRGIRRGQPLYGQPTLEHVPGDQFWLWRTGITPKAEVYIPQERLAR